MLVEVTVKPPPKAKVSLFNNIFTSPPLSSSARSKKNLVVEKNSGQGEDCESKKEVGGKKTDEPSQKASDSPNDSKGDEPENRKRDHLLSCWQV